MVIISEDEISFQRKACKKKIFRLQLNNNPTESGKKTMIPEYT